MRCIELSAIAVGSIVQLVPDNFFVFPVVFVPFVLQLSCYAISKQKKMLTVVF